MPGPYKGYTTPHNCATVSDSKRNQPSDRDLQARCKLQEKETYIILLTLTDPSLYI